MFDFLKKTFLRRHFLIEPKVQLTITGYLIAINLISFVFTFLLVYSAVKSATTEVIQSAPACEAQISALGQAELENYGWIFAACGIATLIIGLMGGILVSHRAVGPVFRLRKILKLIEEGKPIESVSVRRHDFFADLFPQIERIAKLCRK